MSGTVEYRAVARDDIETTPQPGEWKPTIEAAEDAEGRMLLTDPPYESVWVEKRTVSPSGRVTVYRDNGDDWVEVVPSRRERAA